MKSAIILIFLISSFLFSTAQSTNGSTKQSQDSVAKLQADAAKYLDSLSSKISLKEFKDFLYESVSGKEYNEGLFVNLYNFFMQQKLNAWLAQREKNAAAKPPPKN